MGLRPSILLYGGVWILRVNRLLHYKPIHFGKHPYFWKHPYIYIYIYIYIQIPSHKGVFGALGPRGCCCCPSCFGSLPFLALSKDERRGELLPEICQRWLVGKKFRAIFPQIGGIFHGDECHGRIRKRITVNKQRVCLVRNPPAPRKNERMSVDPEKG